MHAPKRFFKPAERATQPKMTKGTKFRNLRFEGFVWQWLGVVGKVLRVIELMGEGAFFSSIKLDGRQ